MKVPWCIPNYHRDDIRNMKRIIDSGWLSMGSEVQRFEETLTDYLGVKYGVAVNNGTSALDTMLKSLGIKQGDEIIIPALTYIATANSVLYNHAKPVYVDVDNTLNIDTMLIEKAITKHTKAIMNIDYGGNPSDYHTLKEITNHHNLPLLIDGAQSLGAIYHHKKLPTQGLMNTLSFHQAKILTTVEGGMILTNNKKHRDTMRIIRNQGQKGRFNHAMLGNNYRMTDVTAAMGTSQTQRLQHTLKTRQHKATYYKEHLQGVDYPEQHNHTTQSYFLFLIQTNHRNKLLRHLTRHHIETRVYTPLKKRINASYQVERTISLPMYHTLNREQQDYVIQTINRFQSRHQG